MKFPPNGISNEIEIGCPLLPPEVAGRGFVVEPIVKVAVPEDEDVDDEDVVDEEDVEEEVVVDVDDALGVVDAPADVPEVPDVPDAPDICPT